MKVVRWGNSLAIRLPASVVEALGLKKGDELNVHAITKDNVGKLRASDELVRRLRKHQDKLPPDFIFDRDKPIER